MSFEWEEKVGEKLDQALGDTMNLYFQPTWHPKHRHARRRSRAWRIGLGTTAAAAAVFLSLPFFVQPSQGQQQALTGTLATLRLPSSLRQSINAICQGAFTVTSMVPVYDTYPLAHATGHNLRLQGRFNLAGSNGNSLSLLLNNHMQIVGGMLFQSGSPVYSFSGSNMSGGAAIVSPKATQSSTASQGQAQWYSGGFTDIETFSAAGSHVYVTHGNLWADVLPDSDPMWMESPASPSSNTVDSIAGLPSAPDDALLLEESPSGLSRGFTTTNGGTSWQAWGLGAQSISMLIAMGSRYWAVVNGSLSWSANGQDWNNVLSLNAKHWQVETYAINPANQNVAVAALIPIGGDGIGPVLETQNGGVTWTNVPNFPAIGAAPSTMVMNSNGDIAALINADGPVVVRYTAATQEWSILPVPSSGSSAGGLGQLASAANGNLIYGAPQGKIFEWIESSGKWIVINPPNGLDNAGVAAFPLQAVGNNQILAGYPSGWAFYYNPSQNSPAKTLSPAAANP